MHAHLPRRFAVFLILILAAAPTVAQTTAQATATIRGRVTTSQGGAVTDATITLLELRRSTTVDANGAFRFDGVPPAHYHVVAESRRFGALVAEADVEAGQTREIEMILDPAIHSEEIVVTASPDARRESEVYQPVNVISDAEIAVRLQPTIGETLAQEPGVTSTYFGPGSSRPIIRGLGADRIRILEGGVGTGDASNISPDHAVSVDPANAEQIEIVRGPATLLYGSNAVGGVVNVITESVPTTVPTQLVTGNADLRLGSGNDERTGSFSVEGAAGKKFAWHADFLKRDTDDVDIPDGVLPNSSLETRSGTLGASYVGARGFLGLAYGRFDTNYGIPGEEGGPRIDLEQNRLDLRGELRELGFFRNVRLRVGRTDYEHVELEGEEIGTRFTNDGLEGRLEAAHRPFGQINGSFGIQYTNNDFAAIGEEAFIPPNETTSRAIFAFEEVTRGRWDLQFGARYENQDVKVADAALPDRSFGGLSGSVGAIFRPFDGWNAAISLARAVRLPTATELFANGPHVATGQFEVGNPELDEETTLGIDLSLRKTEGRFRGTLNLFQNYFDGYIFDAPTGEEEEDLPLFQYVQADARFRGVELDTHTELWHSGEKHIEFEAGADYVRATLEDGGGNLPRIPPLRLSIGIRFQGGPYSFWAEARRFSEQDETAAFEEPTDGFTLVNASVGYRFFVANTVHDLLLRGTNLTDQLARMHTSPLKEVAPLPGRDFSLSYRVTF